MSTRRQFLRSISTGAAAVATGVLKPAAVVAAPAAVIPAARTLTTPWIQFARSTHQFSGAYIAELERIMMDADVSKFQARFH